MTLALPVAALCLAVTAPAPGAPGPVDPPPDITTLVHEAQRAQQADAAAWRRFRFSRGVRTERLGADGRTLSVEETLSEVTPLRDRFDERLLRIDGREPTDKEIATHRQKEPFAKHYRTLRAGGDETGEEGGYSLTTLLRLSAFVYAGREVVDGAECHRLDFQPDPERRAESLAARVAGAMAGRIWLTVDGLHMIRAQLKSVRPVPLTLGLVSVRSVEIDLDVTEIAEGTWLPRRLAVVSDVRIIFMGQVRRRVFTYSDYAPVAHPRAGS